MLQNLTTTSVAVRWCFSNVITLLCSVVNQDNKLITVHYIRTSIRILEIS